MHIRNSIPVDKRSLAFLRKRIWISASYTWSFHADGDELFRLLLDPVKDRLVLVK